MDVRALTQEFDQDAAKAVTHFKEEMSRLRTGRAHAGMLDGVVVEAYGQSMPLKSVASIAVPEPQLLQITPFDPGTLAAIADAIRSDQSLGLNPADDGRVVRVPIPALTTERRELLVRQLNERKEECYVALRQARHEAMRKAKAAKDAKTMSEDDERRVQKQIDDAMVTIKSDVEAAAKAKEQDIRTL